VSHLGEKAIASHGAQSQGVRRKNHMGYLGAIMLEAYEYLAGGYLCPKLLTF
jgi:hypothetical protein